jgi:DNA replication and repair protein RecF
MRSLAVQTLSVRGFRNLRYVDIELGPHVNVVSGDNGQGKTNLLEAVYVLATSRSFRTARLVELVGVGTESASLRACIVEADESREQTVGLRRGLRAVRVDGKRPATLSDYAVRTPTVVFHPGAMSLSAGSGGERRRLLDRVALYLSPSSLAAADAYARAARARQRALETRGTSAADLDAWEVLMVEHGRAVSFARAAAAALLIPEAIGAFRAIGAAGLDLGITYVPGAPDTADSFLAKLSAGRGRDRARGSASVGPHRDDLSLVLAGMPVRTTASQGQHRAVVLALKLAEISVVASARSVSPLLLLDDVSSELDRARTSALMAAIHSGRGQVVITTTRPELVASRSEANASSRRDFRVVGGEISVA